MFIGRKAVREKNDKTIKPPKIKRTRKVRNLNIGILIIALVFIYMVVNIAVSLRKEHLSVYEVQAERMAFDRRTEAVIIRNEQGYYTDKAGYTNFYVRNGARIAVGNTVYSIDESKNIHDYLSEYNYSYSFSTSDVNSLKNYVSRFGDKFDTDDYSDVYELKENIESEILSISDTYVMEHLSEIMEGQDKTVSFNVVKSENSGVVSFFSDSLDGIKADDVGPKSFDKTTYNSKNLYDSEIKEQNALVYKLILDENWSLVIRLSDEQYNKLAGKSSISFTIRDDDFHVTQKCSFFMKDNEHFCKVDMTDYAVRYLKQRFLDIELDISDQEGLKIPTSSLTTKEFYVIPSEYYISYEDENEVKYGFTYMNYDKETRQTSYEFVPAECYYEDKDKGVVYVDTKDFEHGQYVYCMEDETLYQVSVIESLEGVFNVNKGYAIFRRIEMITRGDEYCIVAAGADRSLSVHDHIVLNSKLIDENLQIY